MPSAVGLWSLPLPDIIIVIVAISYRRYHQMPQLPANPAAAG
jgi:hypothetical protein